MKKLTVKVIAESRTGKFLLRWTKRNGKPGERNTGLFISNRKNRVKAGRLAKELEDELNGKRSSTTWLEFEKRYKSEHLNGLSDASVKLWEVVSGYVDSILAPVYLNEIDTSAVSLLVKEMRKSVPSETSINTYIRTLRASLNWAFDMDMIDEVPKYRKLRKAKKSGKKKPMRGRPLRLEEVEKMQLAAEEIRKNDHQIWKDYIEGLYKSGLRLEESIILSFSPAADFWVDLDCEVPRYRIRQEGQKSNQEQVLPIAPEFVEYLRKLPHNRGLVFRLPCRSKARVSRIVSDIGRESKVITDHKTKRHPTAHDLRRTFGSLWVDAGISPQDLQLLMRHESIETTMRYYVEVNSDNLGKRLQAIHDQQQEAKGGESVGSKEKQSP